MMENWMFGYGMGGWGIVFWITTILIWVALALAIAALWRWLNKK